MLYKKETLALVTIMPHTYKGCILIVEADTIIHTDKEINGTTYIDWSVYKKTGEHFYRLAFTNLGDIAY